ncbi:sulfotransferase [Gemmatimonas sp.]
MRQASTSATSEGRWPDFLVVGAGRAGTTSLHQYLARHPDVYLPKAKAPSYWYAAARPATAQLPAGFVRSEHTYKSLFGGCRADQRCGEVSPVYLAATDVPARVMAQCPDMRIILILRHPVDRVYARWVARRRDGLEPTPTFEALLDQEWAHPLERDDAHATYMASGIVTPTLREWFALVPEERRLVLWFEDFARDTAGSMRTVCRFLGVRDDIDLGTARRHNASGGRIRHPWVRGIWAASFPLRRAVRPLVPVSWRDAAFRLATRRVDALPLAADTRARLTARYAKEIRALAELTGRDLTAWLGPTPAQSPTGLP